MAKKASRVRRLRIALASLTLAGCERAITDRIDDLGEVETTASCIHPGICATMMPGFDGKMNYAIKFSPYCPGTEPAIGRQQRETFHYKSDPSHPFTRDYITDIRPTGGQCT